MKGLDLASTQRLIGDLLRGSAPIEGDAAATALADAVAMGSDRLTPAMQLEIYREQFFLRHVDALRDDFRALEHLLGDDAFVELARAYLSEHPPRSFTLRDLGARLAGFVGSVAPWAEDPFAFDLARVEWAFVEAFDAADAPALDVAAIGAVPEDVWPLAHIVLQPSVQRLALAHPAHDYRLAARKSADAENLVALATLAPPEPRPAYVVVYRAADSLACIDLEPCAFALLEALGTGAAIGDACERVASTSGMSEQAFEEKVGEWFRDWTALGFISRIER